MRPGFGSGIATTAESMNYARQFGVVDVVPDTSGLPSINGTWSMQDLVKLRTVISEPSPRAVSIVV